MDEGVAGRTMRRRTKRLLAMTVALVAACGAFVLWDEFRGGFRVTMVNRTPERYVFEVLFSGAVVPVELSPGESRSLRIHGVFPLPAGDQVYPCLGIQFLGGLPGTTTAGIAAGAPKRWGVIELRSTPRQADGHDRECLMTVDAPIDWRRLARGWKTLPRALSRQSKASMTFRAPAEVAANPR